MTTNDDVVQHRKGRTWLPEQLIGMGQAEGLLISDALAIRRILIEQAAMNREVAVHRHNGEFVGAGCLEIDSGLHVYIRLRSESRVDACKEDLSLNGTTTTEQGLVLFTLSDLAWMDFDLVQSRWPTQLVCVHTRRHMRLVCRQQQGVRVDLSFPLASVGIEVCDLSEDGIAFDFDAPSLPRSELMVNGELCIGARVLRVPWMQIVHMRKTGGGMAWHVGARLLGLSKEDRLALSVWLNQNGQAATADSTGSNR